MIAASFLLFTAWFCAIYWVAEHWWKNRRFYRLISKIPNIKGHVLFLGHAFKFIGADNKKIFELIALATAPSPVSPRKFWEGPIMYVVIDDPEQIRKVLSSKYHIDKPESVYANFKVVEGIFVINGNRWRHQRKLIDPAFSPSVFKSFLPIFNEKTKVFIKMLETRANGSTPVNIHDSFAPLALDNILSSSLGLNDEKIQTEKDNAYVKHCTEAMKVFAAKISKVWYKWEFLYKRTETYVKEQRHVNNGMYVIGNEIVAQKEQNYKKNVEYEEELTGKPHIFIDQVYKMRSQFEVQEIRDNVNTFMFAGFETISNTMSMTVLLLAMHPRVQDKLYKEIQQLFKSRDEEVTDDHLDKLVYTEMVLKEAMRIWPAIPFLARNLSQDLDLKNCIVPTGSNIAIPVFHVHRSKKIWGEDAEEFRPERFEPEEFDKIPPYAYLPFSKGPRICPGTKYAMNSMKVTLAYLMRNFKVSSTLKLKDTEFEFAVLLGIHSKCMVTLEKRT